MSKAILRGVPQTAADGCRLFRSENASTRCFDSVRAPVTSVAKCMTLARWRTKGDSGTFVDEQKGSSASATDRTAYSCSSRSLEDRAREAASAKSFASSPVFGIVPAKTREVTIPRERRSKSSGVAPTSPSTANVHVDGYSDASFFKIGRASISVFVVATRSRASTTLSTFVVSILVIACATRSFHAAVLMLPSLNVKAPCEIFAGLSGRSGCAVSPIHVIHDCRPFCPTTTFGITSTDSWFLSNEKEAKRTGPVPLP